MDNQHKMIQGYRDLSQAEIDLMNKIKTHAKVLGQLVAEIEAHVNAQWESASENENETECTRLYDANTLGWVSRAKDDLQDGFMKLTRSVAQPTTF